MGEYDRFFSLEGAVPAQVSELVEVKETLHRPELGRQVSMNILVRSLRSFVQFPCKIRKTGAV